MAMMTAGGMMSYCRLSRGITHQPLTIYISLAECVTKEEEEEQVM